MAAGAPAPRPERRPAAVLAADVVGFSRLVAEDEEGTLARLRGLRREFGEPLIAAHGGRTVKLAGDGTIVEFPSAVEAVRCAVAFQRGVAEREREIPPARRILFRMGINLGRIVVQDDDVYGNGVNVAARLEQIAAPGGIVVARNVRDQVKAELDTAFQPLGDRRLKNIPEPVEVYAVRFEGAPAVRRRPALGRLRPRRLAVAALLLALAAAIAAWAVRAAPGAVPARVAVPDRPSPAVLAFDDVSGDAEDLILILPCRAQGKAGRYDEAITTGDLAMRLNPIPAACYHAMRAISPYAKGRMEEVTRATTACLNKAPGYAPRRLSLALALSSKRAG